MPVSESSKVKAVRQIVIVGIFIFMIQPFQMLMAQKIEGTYFSEKDSFAVFETPYLKSTVKVQNPFKGGYAAIFTKDGFGVIDTSGNIILKPGATQITIFSAANRVYFGWEFGNHNWKLLDAKGMVYAENQKLIYYLNSKDTIDYFFTSSTEFNYQASFAEGQILAINPKEIKVFVEKEVFKKNKNASYYEDKASNFFYKGLLVSKMSNGFLLLRNFKLDTLYKGFKILEAVNADSLYLIIKRENYKPTMPNAYSLVNAQDRMRIVENIGSNDYRIIEEPYDIIIFKKYSKTGAYVNWRSGKYAIDKPGFFYLPPEYDSISAGTLYKFNTSYKEYRQIEAHKGDSIYYFNVEEQIGNQFAKPNRVIVKYKSANNNAKVGTLGSQTPKTFKWNDYAPNSYWIGTNLTSQDFVKINTTDTFSVKSLSLDAGIGWYEFDDNTHSLYGSWTIYGGGIGLECRIPFEKRTNVIEKSGLPYRQLYLNARAEVGIGGYVGPFMLSGHCHLGYTTDFLYHYIRPGIGLSLTRVQIGLEGFLPFNNPRGYSYPVGIYLRYIGGFDY